MPNDCWNYITITSQNPEELNTLLQNEIKNYHQVDIKQKGKNGVIGMDYMLCSGFWNCGRPRLFMDFQLQQGLGKSPKPSQ